MTESATLIHHLERTLIIGARRETVFRFFTDPVRWASWWGAGSTIEPHPSGRVLIRYPGGTEAVGEVLRSIRPSGWCSPTATRRACPLPRGRRS